MNAAGSPGIDRVIPNSEAERPGLMGIDCRRRILGDAIVEAEGKSISAKPQDRRDHYSRCSKK